MRIMKREIRNAYGLRNYSVEIKSMDFDHKVWGITQAKILTKCVTLSNLIKIAKSQEIFISKNGKV